MNFDLVSKAYAQGSGQPSGGGAPMWPMFLLILAVFYFFLIRPQHKKQKDVQNMLAALAKGDKVVTIGGMFGTIVNIKKKDEKNSGDDIVVLKVSDTTKLEMLRTSIARVIEKEKEPEKTNG